MFINNRLQANRPASLQPVQVAKANSNPILNEQTGSQNTDVSNLSPAILVNINDFKSLLASKLVASSNISNSCSKSESDSSKNGVNSSQSSNQTNSTNENSSNSKEKCLRLGDYVLFDPLGQTDSFSSAYNTKTNRFYCWKKFDEKEYMKKLEPYFIMEGATDKIYKFKEIILESNISSHLANRNAYVIFDQHYGDLHSYMKEKKKLEEPEAKHIFRQCVEAVHKCHENGIMIRDIKLKKFVFLDQEKTTIGLANLEDCLLLDEDAPNDLIKSQQGCPAYVSPEVLNPGQNSYSGRLSDSWSLGIILFTLLVGRYPFHHPTITNMFARIARGKFQIPPSIMLSLDAKLLLRSLIRVKPEERLLPDEILAHNWLKQTELDFEMHKQQQLQQFYLNESKFTPSPVHKIQLGISQSTPIMRSSTPGHNGEESPNIISNSMSCLSKRQALFRSNESVDCDDSDRFVPEFKSNC